MRKISFIAIFFVAATAFAADMDFLYWTFAAQTRLDDQAVLGTFALHSGANIDSLDVYYTSDPIRAYPAAAQSIAPGETPETQSSYCYHSSLAADTKQVQIYSGRFEKIALYAVARMGETVQIAQLQVNLFGESGKIESGFSETDALPPEIQVFNYNRDSFAGVQIGGTSDFFVEAPKVKIYDYGKLTAELESSDGHFSYTFPPDTVLANSSSFVPKDVIMFAETPRGNVSLYIPVYRAFYGNTNLKSGVILLAAVMILCIAVILLRGRKFGYKTV